MFDRKDTPFSLQRLPIMCAASIMSAALLLSGCSSNNDTNAANDNDSDNQAEVITTKKSTNEPTAIDTEDRPNATTIDSNEVPTTDTKTVTGITDTPATDADTVSKAISPIAAAAKEPSLLTNPTEPGTAEDTVKLALDTLYYGDVGKAATYYQVDMENFEEELKNTQFAFQQTVESVTITETKYNKNKTRATVIGELKLKNQSEPAPLSYILQKIDGQWKIMG